MASSLELIGQLHPGLQRFIAERWKDLTKIQEAALPALMEGRDAVVEAPTAGGKTEAVLFPTLTRVAQIPAAGVCILYLAPLRALLNNLQNRGEEYAQLCNLRAFKWHGDVSQKEKLAALGDPPDLLMTTPESVEAILLRKAAWRSLFENLSVVIIDEAHNFAASDRGGHLVSLLERVEEGAKTPPQRIALSATVGNPDALLRWLAGGRRKPGIRIHVEAPPRPREFRVEHFDGEGENEETPAHERATFRRFSSLGCLLSRKRSLVFVPSRAKAENLAKVLTQHRQGSGRVPRIRTHHSNVSKFFREEAEHLIQVTREVGIDAIISTSTLELGIDIGELECVAQMGALASPSSFLQRVGRTGRRPGQEQYFRGYTLRDKDLLLLVATVSLGLEQRSESLDLPKRAFHLLAHQLICLALQHHGIAADSAWAVTRNAHCFSDIDRGEFDLLVGHMILEDYLREADGLLVTADRTEKEYLGAGWRRLFAVFDTAPLYEVVHSRTHVGTLSVGFVEVLEVPFFFVLAGRPWQAEKVDTKAHVVHARPAAQGDAPKWEMTWGLDVPFETAQRVGMLLHGDTVPDFVNEEGQTRIRGLQQTIDELAWEPGRVLIDSHGPVWTTVLTYAGDRINRTLARSLTMLADLDTSANFMEVTIKSRRGRQGDSVDLIEKALHELRSGEWSDPKRLSDRLGEQRASLPFSPFARCLPTELAAKALIERTMTVQGMLDLLQGAWF